MLIYQIIFKIGDGAHRRRKMTKSLFHPVTPAGTVVTG